MNMSKNEKLVEDKLGREALEYIKGVFIEAYNSDEDVDLHDLSYLLAGDLEEQELINIPATYAVNIIQLYISELISVN